MDALLDHLTSRLGTLYEPLKGFGLTTVLAMAIFLHYRRYAGSLSTKQSFGPVLPFVALTTFLVIFVVKSSFALSLGLVGALSIVRFRTPVKDPEELAYIFLTIAAGIGAAAGQIVLTAVIVPLILVVKTVVGRTLPSRTEHVFLSLDVPGVSDPEAAFVAVSGVLRTHAGPTAFLRYEMREQVLHLTAEAEVADPVAMARITAEIRRQYPDAGVTFYDESRVATS